MENIDVISIYRYCREENIDILSILIFANIAIPMLHHLHQPHNFTANSICYTICLYLHPPIELWRERYPRFYNIPEQTHVVHFYIRQLHDFRLINIPRRHRRVKSGNCDKKPESNLTIYYSLFPYSIYLFQKKLDLSITMRQIAFRYWKFAV